MVVTGSSYRIVRNRKFMMFPYFSRMCVLVALHLNIGLVHGQVASLLEIQQKSFRHISIVKSLAYEGRVELHTGAVWKVKMERSGVKYRVFRLDEKPSIIDGEKIEGSYQEYAFDGLRHQAMDERESTMLDQSYLQLSDKQFQNGVNDLVLRPFQWLVSSACVNLEWSQVQSVELWKKRFAVAVDRGEVQKGNERCRAVEFPQTCSDSPAIFRVYFSIEHDYYPIAYERLLENSSESSSSYVLDEFKKLQSGENAIIIPVRGTRTEVGKDRTLPNRTSRFFLLSDTLRVNTIIDDSRFTLVPSKKPLVYDIDEEERMAKQSMEARRAPLPFKPANSWNKVFVGMNVFVAIITLWAIWRMRRA